MLAAPIATGQTGPAFELASVKAAPPAVPGAIAVATVDRGRARFSRMTLAALLAYAYRVRTFQISGPAWINNSTFAIDAKLPAGASADQAPEMLRTLLEQRFQLALHRETRMFPVYALAIGKGGPKMMPRVLGGPRLVNGTMTTTLEGYAAFISDAADRPVVDATNLEGEYLFPINQARVEAYKRRTEARANRPTDEVPSEASEPSGLALARIVKEIGLKLVARKMLLPLLVIDHVEKRPSEN